MCLFALSVKSSPVPGLSGAGAPPGGRRAIEARYGVSLPRVSIAGLPGVALTAAGDLVPAGAPRGLPLFR